MRVTLAGIAVGILLYWSAQHFLGVGITGKGKSA